MEDDVRLPIVRNLQEKTIPIMDWTEVVRIYKLPEEIILTSIELDKKEQDILKELMGKYKYRFEWQHQQMPILDLEVACHKLDINLMPIM